MAYKKKGKKNNSELNSNKLPDHYNQLDQIKKFSLKFSKPKPMKIRAIVYVRVSILLILYVTLKHTTQAAQQYLVDAEFCSMNILTRSSRENL